MNKKIPDSGNSGLSSQQKMVVHYPRTVWENNYAEHEVTGKTYNLKKKKCSKGVTVYPFCHLVFVY